jgi:hypothetical protein
MPIVLMCKNSYYMVILVFPEIRHRENFIERILSAPYPLPVTVKMSSSRILMDHPS